MKGYKGVRYTNGILRAKVGFGKTKDIFEVGVPTQKVKIEEGNAFSENGYSFCGKIEDVLDWENYCKPIKNRKAGVDVRLFSIDTLDSKVIGSSSHYKAEQIIVLQEVSHDEIVQYFTDHPELKESIDDESWDIYCDDKMEAYKVKLDADEINRTIIEQCIRLGQNDLCNQVLNNYELSKCETCAGKEWRGGTFYDLTDYYYLHARRKLHDGIALDDIEEYHELKGCKAEQESLRLLYAWLQENRF